MYIHNNPHIAGDMVIVSGDLKRTSDSFVPMICRICSILLYSSSMIEHRPVPGTDNSHRYQHCINLVYPDSSVFFNISSTGSMLPEAERLLPDQWPKRYCISISLLNWTTSHTGGLRSPLLGNPGSASASWPLYVCTKNRKIKTGTCWQGQTLWQSAFYEAREMLVNHTAESCDVYAS